MKIVELNGITRREDIQIQASCEKIAIRITTDGKWFFDPQFQTGLVYVRLRLISHKAGTVQIIDRMPLSVLLEREGQKFGFFERTDQIGVAGAESEWIYAGSIQVGDGGALELQDGEYLSLDLESDMPFSAQISTIDSPDLVNSYIRINPQTVNGVTREIGLADAKEILVPVSLIRDVQVQYENRATPVTQEEMYYLGMANNETTCMDFLHKRATAGILQHLLLPTKRAKSMTITPQSSTQFYVYSVVSKVK
jgi:hypothetical protein